MKQPVHDSTRDAERRMNLALTSARMVGFEWDMQTDRVHMFGAVQELFGVHSSTAQDYLRLVHPDDRPQVEEAMRTARFQDRACVEYRLVRPDGSIRWICSSGSAVRDADGRPLRIAGLTHDITEHKLAQDQLKALAENLEQRVAQRTRELERRSAQLRGIAAELIQAEQRERRRLAQVIHDNLQQLLVASRMKVGRLIRRAPDPQVASDGQQVDQLLSEAIDASRSLTLELSPPILYEGGLVVALQWLARQMEQKHAMRVEVEVEDSPEPNAQQVRVLLFMAVRELLFNVLKHAGTDAARVRIAPADGQIRIVVEDRGAGFDAQAHDRLAHTTGPDQAGASGFGLFSVRERVQLLGGTVNIASRRGSGTRVELLVPVTAGTSPAAAAPAEPPPAPASNGRTAAEPAPAGVVGEVNLRVLLADDHATVREGLAGLLREQPGIQVVGEAENGLRAVELAGALCPDVVVMDVTMPVLNGVEATRRITRLCPGVRVVGLSMHERDDMAAEMIHAGAATYLTKGIHFDTLIAAIRGETVPSPLSPKLR